MTLAARKAGLGRHVLAYALAMHFTFGSFSLLNGLNLSFFYYYPRMIRIVIFSASIDLSVWIVSVLCISALMIVNLPDSHYKKAVHVGIATLSAALGLTLGIAMAKGFPNGWIVYSLYVFASMNFALIAASKHRTFEEPFKTLAVLTLIYLISFLAIIEISAAVHYSIQSIDVNTPIGRQDGGIELQLSYASYGLIPWLYLVFLFSWAWVPIVQKLVLRRVGRLGEKTAPGTTDNQPYQSSISLRFSRILRPELFLVMAFSVFIGYYTYFQNPPWIVGTDAFWRYHDPLVHIDKYGPFGAFAQALNERHPVPLMILYVVHLALRLSLFDTVRMAQLLLVVILGLSIWWFLAYRRNYEFGLTTYMLSLLSITTTIGFYSSILANWMALVVWVLFSAYFVSRHSGKFGVTDFVILLFLSTLMLFIHPWTWGVFAASIVAVAFVGLVLERRKGLRVAGLLLAVIGVDLALAALTINYLSATQGWRVVDALSYYTYVIDNPSRISWFWPALTWLTRIWSPFFSPLYIALSILGVLSLNWLRIDPWLKRMILAWIFVSGIGSVLVAPIGFNILNPSTSETQLWRLLFITPFPILAPFGLSWLTRRIETGPHFAQASASADTSGFRLKWIPFLALIGFGLAWASMWQRMLLALLVLPSVTGLLLVRTRVPERKVLSDLVLILFLMVAFNNTTRALSQLLRDPHNYRPRVRTSS